MHPVFFRMDEIALSLGNFNFQFSKIKERSNFKTSQSGLTKYWPLYIAGGCKRLDQ
jgi:hypothetical protein